MMHDYMDASLCFSGVAIEGGVCYFLWNLNHNEKCDYYLHQSSDSVLHSKKTLDEDGTSDIVIRDPNLISILNKVSKFKEITFDTIVSSRNPFNISESIDDIISSTPTEKRILCRLESKRQILYLNKDYSLKRGNDYINRYKLFVSKADGAEGQIGNPIPARIIGKAEFGERDMVCSETFLAVGPFQKKEENSIPRITLLHLRAPWVRCSRGFSFPKEAL
jgi:site-specific DNA-methyltransferase (adenine-specific)